MKAALGHDGPPTNYWTENLLTDEKLPECPLRTILRAHGDNPTVAQEVDRHLEIYYPLYKDGHLLEAGGVADQSGRYLDFIVAIRNTEAKVQEKLDAIRAKERETEGTE